jgi:hypothetical protein
MKKSDIKVLTREQLTGDETPWMDDSLLPQTCWDIYIVYDDDAHGQVARKCVYHSHDAEDRDLALQFWMREIERSPGAIRGLEVITVTQTLLKVALKVGGDDDAPVTARIFTSERNHG